MYEFPFEDIHIKDYECLVKYFRSLIRTVRPKCASVSWSKLSINKGNRTIPVIVMIYSLDRLTEAHFRRRELNFLSGYRMSPNSCIVVSALPDENVEIIWKYFVWHSPVDEFPNTPNFFVRQGTDTRLQEILVPRVYVLSYFETT
jgi:hypothetical protein